MRISVIGIGYVGLVTGSCFAENGNDVMCMDVDSDKINRLKEGIIPIYEPHLEELVKNNVKEGRLRFTTDIKEAVDHGLILVIAVNTPQDHDGSADLKYVMEVAHNIGKAIEKYRIIVVKSTVPVGTCEMVKSAVREELEKAGREVSLTLLLTPSFSKKALPSKTA